MKKGFAIALSFFILLQSGILTMQYAFRLSQHKKSVFAALKSGALDAELTVISLDAQSAVQWENGHEFVLGEEKYDVVKTEVVNGETLYHCINDKDEKALLGKMAGSEKSTSVLVELLKKFNLQQMNSFSLQFTAWAVLNNVYNDFMAGHYTFDFIHSLIRPPAL